MTDTRKILRHITDGLWGIVYVTPLVLLLTFIGAVLVGWVMNIVKLIQMIGQEDVSAELFIRLVGIVPPAGAIVGWF